MITWLKWKTKEHSFTIPSLCFAFKGHSKHRSMKACLIQNISLWDLLKDSLLLFTYLYLKDQFL